MAASGHETGAFDLDLTCPKCRASSGRMVLSAVTPGELVLEHDREVDITFECSNCDRSVRQGPRKFVALPARAHEELPGVPPA